MFDSDRFAHLRGFLCIVFCIHLDNIYDILGTWSPHHSRGPSAYILCQYLKSLQSVDIFQAVKLQIEIFQLRRYYDKKSIFSFSNHSQTILSSIHTRWVSVRRPEQMRPAFCPARTFLWQKQIWCCHCHVMSPKVWIPLQTQFWWIPYNSPLHTSLTVCILTDVNPLLSQGSLANILVQMRRYCGIS